MSIPHQEVHADRRPDHDKSHTVIVNGRRREVHQHKLTYLEVVQLAFPGETPSETVVFTVTYSYPHGKDGTMVAGDEVVVKDKMVFNVRKTDQS